MNLLCKFIMGCADLHKSACTFLNLPAGRQAGSKAKIQNLKPGGGFESNVDLELIVVCVVT